MSTGDQRDHRGWVVLDLSRLGEQKAQEGVLESLLRDILHLGRSHPVFVPYQNYVSGEKQVSVQLMEGYAFLAAGLDDSLYLSLEDTPYVKRVLTSRGQGSIRTMTTLPDSRIREMQARLAMQVSRDLLEGAEVRITGGTYEGLDGHVIEIADEYAHVEIILRSMTIMARIPRAFLAPLTDGVLETT